MGISGIFGEILTRISIELLNNRERFLNVINMKNTIFFAYKGKAEGFSDGNVDAIKSAIQEYNKHQKTYRAHSWEDFRKTTLISKEIMEAIRESEIFVCDFTYFNHNVLFELGYALGLNKKIIVFLNTKIKLADPSGFSEDIYKNSIFKNIRYKPLTNKNDILSALQNKDYDENLLAKFTNTKQISQIDTSLFYIKSSEKNQSAIELDSAIEDLSKDGVLTYTADDPVEVAYNTPDWYLKNIYESKHILIHFLGDSVKNAYLENAKKSFFAGISIGLSNKNTLLVAPAKYNPPLDYHDMLFQYQTPSDLIEKLIDWAPKDKIILKQQDEHDYNLLKLGIGCAIAEEERENLLNYFVDTASSYAALANDKSIFVGRKGSGKSAIHIKLQELLAKDKRNYLLNLKPESEELLENLHLSDLYKAHGSKKSFFKSTWKFVALSKLLCAVYERLTAEKDAASDTIQENKILDFYVLHRNLLKMNFFAVVKYFSSPDRPESLNNLYNEYLNELVKILKEYFASINCKYMRIIILADNLDQAWNAEEDLDIQVGMISALLEIDEKIKNELQDSKGCKVEVKKVLFLRRDIFDYICKKIGEPDKLVAMSHTINWDDYPNLLKKVIDNRFKHILNLSSDEEVDKTWENFFEKDKKSQQHPFETIMEIVATRPRDIIFFISKLLESAFNKDHKKANHDDYLFAIEAYTKFINQNLIAEAAAEFSEISEILAKLQRHYGQQIKFSEFDLILDAFNYDSDKKMAFMKRLFDHQYMIAYDAKTNRLFSYEEILERLSQKFSFFKPRTWFKSKDIYVIAHAKQYLIQKRFF